MVGSDDESARRWATFEPPSECASTVPRSRLDCVHALDLDDGQHVLVSTQTLWGLCATLSTLEALAGTVKARITALEQETGRQCYGMDQA